jgi:hypothetical protein
MPKLPTDLEIFECIYDLYLAEFRIETKENSTRSSKIYVPVDLEKVASKLDSDAHELFGRLYYHLDHKYGYKQENGAHVNLFTPAVGGDRHSVNFPYLAAVLAEHRLEDKRNKWSLRISLVALGVAIASLLARFFGGS